MHALTPLWRSLRIAEHLATGALVSAFVAVGRPLGLQAHWLSDVVRWWHARLCRSVGLDLEVSGEPVPGALLVANHVSWLDVPIIGAQGRIAFLSKAEVREWPLVGWLAHTAGTLFISRGANRTGELVGRIGAYVRGGGLMVIFPEGTTTDGTHLLRFHPRLFSAGQQESMLVQPVALRYGTNAKPDPIAPFIGDDALIPHLLRLVRHPALRVQVSFLAPIEGNRLDRDALSRTCREAIADRLGLAPSDAAEPGNAKRSPFQAGTDTPLGEAA